MAAKSYYQRKRAIGLCGHCGKEPLPGYSYCAACRARQNKTHAVIYRRHLTAGLCGFCKNLAIPGQTRCQQHLDQAMQHATVVRRRKAAAKKALAATLPPKPRRGENGVCSTCDNLTSPGWKRCQACNDKSAEKLRRKRAALVAAGLCSHCGTQPIVPGRAGCQECLAKAAKAAAETNANYRAGGLCGQCGRPARPGKTACALCARAHADRELKRQRRYKQGTTDRTPS